MRSVLQIKKKEKKESDSDQGLSLPMCHLSEFSEIWPGRVSCVTADKHNFSSCLNEA